MNPQLVLDAARAQGIGLFQMAGLFHQHLGRQEKGDAAHALGRAGQAGQHQMDDILGRVVIAPGDEDLLAVQAVAAIAVRGGGGADLGQV